jgi:hypothetical protein
MEVLNSMDLSQKTIPEATTVEGTSLNSAVFYLASVALFMAWQWFHSFSQLLLRIVWSDEGKTILGTSVFYPTAAMTILFIVARMVPTRAVKSCACFCKRKALAAWKTIRMAIARLQSMFAKIVAKRAQIRVSLRVLIGAFEIICL